MGPLHPLAALTLLVLPLATAAVPPHPPGSPLQAPLVLHHIDSCSQCGRPSKGPCPGPGCGSWCQLPPNCTAFREDATHVIGEPLSALGCDKLPSCGRDVSWRGQPVATTYCLHGGSDLYAATNASVPPPTSCPADAQPLWHLPARCEEGDVNALFQWEGVWHLMQQWHARPATSVGHSVSTDLLRFARLPDALVSGETADQQCYDGSGSITSRGPMLMIDGGCGFHNASPGQTRCMESSGHDTGGVTAWPADPGDLNLTRWRKEGPTQWRGCLGASGPSPSWRNPVTGKQQLVAINGSNGDALFEATDATLTSWARVDSSFTSMRGGGGQLWHPLPAAVDGVTGGTNFTHIIQVDPQGSGLPYFVLLRYDYATSTVHDMTEPVLLDVGSVMFGQLSSPGGTAKGGAPGDVRTIHVSWSPAAHQAAPCGPATIDKGQLTSLRDLRFDPRLGPTGRLVETPIAEYLSLRTDILARGEANLNSSTTATTILSFGTGPLAADFELDLTMSVGASVTIGLACGANPNACGGSFGLTMKNETTMAFGPGGSFPLLPGEHTRPVAVRVMLDVRSMEIFVQGGRAVQSTTVSYAACAGGGCTMVASSHGAGLVHVNATVFGLRSLFD